MIILKKTENYLKKCISQQCMELKDVQANKGNIDVIAEITTKEEPRTFEKFGKTGRVCSAKVKDHTGELTLTLWNDDVDKVNVGDKIHLQNGWCSEFRGEKQLSSGKFGKIEVVGANPAAKDAQSLKNTAKTASKSKRVDDDDDDNGDVEEEVV